MNRSRLIGAAVAASVTLAISAVSMAPASAHVRVDGDVAPGGNGTITFTVPSESDTATTVLVEIKIPDEHPLGSLRTEVTPGWTATTTMRTLEEPIEVFGREVTEVVDTVTFTAEPGGGIPPGHFARFSLRGGPFPEDVEQVAFPTIQTYDDGEEAAWIEDTVEGQPEPESPAPVLTLTAEAGSSGDHGGGDDGADDADEPTDDATAEVGESDDGTDALTVVALIVAVVALAVGGASLAAARRTRA